MAHTHSSHTPDAPTQGLTEPDFVDVRRILSFGIGLAVVTAISHFAMLAMFWSINGSMDKAEPARVYPLAIDQDQRQPPEPRLQTNPKQDLKDLRAAEDVVLNGYSWVDRNNSVVRIPVAEAMKLTLERGLPSRPAATPAVPPATVDAGKEPGK